MPIIMPGLLFSNLYGYFYRKNHDYRRNFSEFVLYLRTFLRLSIINDFENTNFKNKSSPSLNTNEL